MKVFEDGLILKSQAYLFAARGAEWTKAAKRLRDAILDRLSTLCLRGEWSPSDEAEAHLVSVLGRRRRARPG